MYLFPFFHFQPIYAIMFEVIFFLINEISFILFAVNKKRSISLKPKLLRWTDYTEYVIGL